MKVVILCGGQGTRLREETAYRPKPMVEIGGRPILWHIMKSYSHYGFNDFILCLGYKGEAIKEYFLNYECMSNDFTIGLGLSDKVTIHRNNGKREDWRVTLVDTGAESLTGTRIKRVEPYLDGERFLATYGDGIADVDIKQLIEHHETSGKAATLTGVHPPSRYGVVGIQDTPDGEKVIGFSEKPRIKDIISAGFFVFEKRVLDYIPEKGCMLEHEPFERLASEGQFSVYRHEGYWHCMDTYRDYLELNQAWEDGAPWKVWE